MNEEQIQFLLMTMPYADVVKQVVYAAEIRGAAEGLPPDDGAPRLLRMHRAVPSRVACEKRVWNIANCVRDGVCARYGDDLVTFPWETPTNWTGLSSRLMFLPIKSPDLETRYARRALHNAYDALLAAKQPVRGPYIAAKAEAALREASYFLATPPGATTTIDPIIFHETRMRLFDAWLEVTDDN